MQPSRALIVNGREHRVSAAQGTPLLWVIRDELKLTGTKFGCGVGQCGACTVHADGRAIRACVTPADALAGVKVTTIEGLAGDHPLQEAWVRLNVPQCGYCQPGQIMAAAALLGANPKPSDAEIDAAMVGNICRCGAYQRIRAAIREAAHGA